jgi:hypothetical protein
MKKTDIAMIILIAAVSAGLAYVIANSLFGGLGQEAAKVKTVERIQSVLQSPSGDVFNENAINPAVEVQVEGSEEEQEAEEPPQVEEDNTNDEEIQQEV